jgi:uncharacterized membrane protein
MAPPPSPPPIFALCTSAKAFHAHFSFSSSPFNPGDKRKFFPYFFVSFVFLGLTHLFVLLLLLVVVLFFVFVFVWDQTRRPQRRAQNRTQVFWTPMKRKGSLFRQR